ncbi:MarR family transcriptional regulator [Jonesiaceae bacterium BS-20]|uniref:MarR family transcriptional regulator n=1 Tax=Jonesiaceae bacterium BS-20 TaxID=3120821 RepID=A0AAU7E086_9MICO
MTAQRATPGVAAQAWEALFRAQVELLRRFESDAIFGDITFKEYDVLFTLRSGPEHGMRLKDLNRAVLLHQSALSRLVERLEQRGLLLRCADESDGRGTMIQLTEQGLDKQREVGRKHVGQIQAYVGGALTTQELEQLTSIASKLRQQQTLIPSVKDASNVQ